MYTTSARPNSSRLLLNGKYSDMTIVCKGNHYSVHKAIICEQCKFFAKAVDEKFKEVKSSEFVLKDDRPLAVRAMLQYLYTRHYDHTAGNGNRASEM